MFSEVRIIGRVYLPAHGHCLPFWLLPNLKNDRWVIEDIFVLHLYTSGFDAANVCGFFALSLEKDNTTDCGVPFR